MGMQSGMQSIQSSVKSSMSQVQSQIESMLPNTPDMNVSRVERIASLIAGGIVLYTVARKSWFRILLGAGAGYLLYRGLTGKDPLFESMGIRRAETGSMNAIKVDRAVTVNKPVDEVYNYWHNFENLPRFMQHLEAVTVMGPRQSHWVAKGPLESRVEWDAEITDERTNEYIAWQSLPGSSVPNHGRVEFRPAPGGRGTEVHVWLEYNPPLGGAGAAFARLFGEEPDVQVREDLRHFKQVMETGEVPTTNGQSVGIRR
jgi:uncharacterized membrane protein